MRILLVEDEQEMSRLIARSVGATGFMVDCVASIAEAEAALVVGSHALVLLDRRLPDGDGLSLLRSVRARRPGVPVIVLTALDDVRDKVRGLDAGADDYLAKPFDAEELLARIRAALRRPGGEPPPLIRCGDLRFDPASREVAVAGRLLVLGRRELALLEALIRRTGRVVQRSTLLDEVYGFDDEIQSNALDAHVSRLRARLGAARVTIHPVRGIGYMLDET
jgi:two-component system OmpR family response regulator